MKTVSIGITVSLMFLFSATSHAEVIDLLKPEYQKKEKAVQKLMDELAGKGITYDLKIVRKSSGGGVLFSRGRPIDYNEYSVTLLGGISNKVHSLDRQVKRDILFDYLDMGNYSFYAAVLMVEDCGDKFVPDIEDIHLGGSKQEMFDGIVKKNKKLWDTQLRTPLNYTRMIETLYDDSGRQSRRDMFLDSYFYAIGGGGQKPSYKNAVLYESIPAIYYEEVFKATNNIWKIYFQGWKVGTLEEWIKKFPFLIKGSALAFVRKHDGTIYQTPLFDKWEESRIQDTQKFLKICRENDPTTKPYLSALMMGLFTMDGYAFNDATGVYTMNERGRMLIDFIAEFPIPENATRLQAVMNGGNKEEIEAMMKKHGTADKWQELLKIPSTPNLPNTHRMNDRWIT